MTGLEPEDLPNVVAVYVQPESDDVAGCVIVEVAGGPKRYARYWSRKQTLEWGWTLHPTAQRVWPNP